MIALRAFCFASQFVVASSGSRAQMMIYTWLWSLKMPDFERLSDQFRIDMENDPIQKARLRGIVEGKTRARLEIAGLALIAAAVSIFSAWIMI